MTPRERLLSTILGEPTDRAPFVTVFGPWGTAMERWRREGLAEPENWAAEFGFDPIFAHVPVNLGWCPAWPQYEVLEDHGETVIARDWRGLVLRDRKDRASMPEFLENPVKTRDDWERIKAERFDPDDPGRFGDDWTEWCRDHQNSDVTVLIGTFPWGIFGTPRDLVGVEELLLLFYDDPEWVHDMMDHLTDMWVRIYEKVARQVRIDWIHIWEDMAGRQGSLISPEMFREFMTPNYRKIREFADANDIRVISVDTDGDCTAMVPWFAEAGVNVLYPFERQAGCDLEAIRDAHPDMGMMGGFDKRALAKGEDAIDAELEVHKRMLRRGRFVTFPDHLVPHDVSWANMKYYCRRWKAMCYGT